MTSFSAPPNHLVEMTVDPHVVKRDDVANGLGVVLVMAVPSWLTCCD